MRVRAVGVRTHLEGQLPDRLRLPLDRRLLCDAGAAEMEVVLRGHVLDADAVGARGQRLDRGASGGLQRDRLTGADLPLQLRRRRRRRTDEEAALHLQRMRVALELEEAVDKGQVPGRVAGEVDVRRHVDAARAEQMEVVE